MRIHTCLTRSQLYAALPDGVNAYITPKGSRKRERAFEVTLYVMEKNDLHRRYGNSGGYGNSNDVAATWDEWGMWMVELYALDPDALIGWYADEADFYAKTYAHREYVLRAHKPGSLATRTQTAPWLDSVKGRLECLRAELRAENISYGELIELQGLADQIDPGDVELLEAAGVSEARLV